MRWMWDASLGASGLRFVLTWAIFMGSADMRSQVSQEHLGVIVRKTPVAHVLQVSYTVNANYLEIIGKRLEYLKHSIGMTSVMPEYPVHGPLSTTSTQLQDLVISSPREFPIIVGLSGSSTR